jgi:hypothetical protein
MLRLMFTTLLVFLAVTPSLAQADTWSLVGDFGINNGNPNGAWTYGYYSQWNHESNEVFPFEVYPAPFNNGNTTGWGDSVNGPLVWRNETQETLAGVAPGQVALHGGRTTQSVVRWQSPVDGFATVNGQFLPGDFGSPAIRVYKNGGLATLWSDTNAMAFSGSISLTAGDTIDFMVDWATGGNTPLEATIEVNSTPEPSTLTGLTGLGAVGALIGWRRWREVARVFR